MIFKSLTKNFYINLIFIFLIFILDRISKLHILNLAEVENNVDIYINSYLNFHLIWNTGIGFGLFSSENNFYYNYEKVYGYSHKKLDFEITKLRLRIRG